MTLVHQSKRTVRRAISYDTVCDIIQTKVDSFTESTDIMQRVKSNFVKNSSTTVPIKNLIEWYVQAAGTDKGNLYEHRAAHANSKLCKLLHRHNAVRFLHTDNIL